MFICFCVPITTNYNFNHMQQSPDIYSFLHTFCCPQPACLHGTLTLHSSAMIKVTEWVNHCVLVLLRGLVVMMKALWGQLSVVSSSCGCVTLYQSSLYGSLLTLFALVSPQLCFALRCYTYVSWQLKLCYTYISSLSLLLWKTLLLSWTPECWCALPSGEGVL